MHKKVFAFAVSFVLIISTGCAYGAEAISVTQPAYDSMSFYVYKPADVPNEFYATYDGYLVYQDGNGIWNYASYGTSGIQKTGYVVGSVIPSVVKLKPYDAGISSVAPVLENPNINEPLTIKPAGTRFAPDDIISLELDTPEVLRIDVTPITRPEPKKKPETKTKSQPEPARAVYSPPPANTGFFIDMTSLTPNAADWTQNSNFIAIGKWRNSVDRIGVLDKPQTPVAWKGEYPEIIYAWTGTQWRQIPAKGRHISALSTIRRGIYGLTVHTNKLNVLDWNDNDTYVLSQYARMWGYQWLGQLLINREY